MTTFNDRETAFEAKFASDEAMEFKAQARRDRMLALWAGELMGLGGSDLENYVAAVWREDLKHAGDTDVCDKVTADLKAKGLDTSEVRPKLDALLIQARRELYEGVPAAPAAG